MAAVEFGRLDIPHSTEKKEIGTFPMMQLTIDSADRLCEWLRKLQLLSNTNFLAWNPMADIRITRGKPSFLYLYRSLHHQYMSTPHVPPLPRFAEAPRSKRTKLTPCNIINPSHIRSCACATSPYVNRSSQTKNKLAPQGHGSC